MKMQLENNKDEFAGNRNIITPSITLRLSTSNEHQNYGFQTNI